MIELLKIACAPFLTAALTVAARAGIADLLHDGPRSSDELAAATGLHPAVLLRILRVLAASGVFQRREDGLFENNRTSEPLRSDHPTSVRHFCILAGSEYTRAFTEIMHTAVTGESAFQHLYGESIYGYMDRTPEAGRIYDLAMADLARPAGSLIAQAFDFSGVRVVADIGGGGGALLGGILPAWPELRAICFDRRDVCLRGRERIAKGRDRALAHRIEFVEGDFFESVPEGSDVYILKNVLHNWNDESGLKILVSIRRAMKPEARLLVVEALIQENSADYARLMNDLFQMVVCEDGATARTESRMRDLLRRAGFRVTGIIALATGSHLTVCEPDCAHDIRPSRD